MKEKAPVLVVIPCLNEEAHLPGLLKSLADDPCSGLIVVADGGSTDGSKQIVRDAAQGDTRIVLLDNPKRIQSAGINLAVERYGGDYRQFVRVDAHCRYPAGYVTSLVEAASRTGAGSVVVSMVTEADRGCFQKGVAAAQNSVLGTGGSAHRHVGTGRWVEHGHHALMTVSEFQAVGGYCEGFRANEDAELDIRLTRRGTRIWLEAPLAITYFPRRSARRLWTQYLRYGEGRAMTIKRHRPPVRLRQVLPLTIVPAVVAAILAPFHLPGSAAFAVPLACWVVAALLVGAAIAARQRSWCALWSGVAALIMHAAWSAGFWMELLRSLRRVGNARQSTA
ncbi:glycosyltransferase family 2 protein [Alteraurantiacibacter aquimixticola]|uniref:Glycosyltransferase family 2 protein n=2 Tax=Alteraurantiacibacter aquimixticola TaxID=2489173 RepID=A0A4T3FAJ9_9SPHN|nr:glycosyltransferase family 2 protein [Alteraurantiacibacter aquimixticola]